MTLRYTDIGKRVCEGQDMDEGRETGSIPGVPESGPLGLFHSPTLARPDLLVSPEETEVNSVPTTPGSSFGHTPPVSTPGSQLNSPRSYQSPLPQSSDVKEINSIPAIPRGFTHTPQASAPASQLHSPSMSRSPLLTPTQGTPRTPMFFRTPMASPMRKAVVSMRGYLEEVGHLTKLDPHDAWLPITESRNGNALYSAFHTLSSGIGFQALVLPVAFTVLGWTWGIILLSLAFIWQLYTLWLLVQLHESVPGTRYSRYLQLAKAVFGPKLGNILALVPIIYLSAGTCTALMIVGGGTLKLFFQTVCGPTCESNPLTTIEWYLVFICLAAVLSQLPNLNSIAGVSLIGAVTAVTYCTMIWTISICKGKQPGVSYHPVKEKSELDRVLSILNALGIIAFAFRGHNLILEIQATMPSTLKHPSHIPMWRGVKAGYTVVAFCLYPMAIGGFWAYGNMIPQNGILTAMFAFHSQDTSRVVLGLTALLVVINCLASFQIYAMPIFDMGEASYTNSNNKPCPRWVRAANRVLFAAIAFLIGVAFPFLPQLAGLIGAVALPVTLAYPCFMWIMVKKPEKYQVMWYINWGLGSLGMVLSVVLVIGGVWGLINTGVNLHFFKPK